MMAARADVLRETLDTLQIDPGVQEDRRYLNNLPSWSIICL